jgi:hypothetical protein
MDSRPATRVWSPAVRRRGRTAGGLATLLVSLVSLALPACAGAASPDGHGFEARTLRREHDPVIVRTGLLTGMPDRDTGRCRLYAVQQGHLVPIPFQFDARDADGALVLSEDGAETEFAFDDDDELVFMAKDAGDRAAAPALPATRDGALEIEVAERHGSGRAWVYLAHFPADPPARSPVRYATFDPARQEARALSYQVAYSRDASNVLTAVRIPPAAGGTGESVIERLRMRIMPTFSFFVTTLHLTLTEESFSVVSDGVKNGPVRAVRRVRQSLDLGRAFPEIPNGQVVTYYYASSFVTPSRFSVPWLALKTLRDFDFESLDELGPETRGMRYWDAANPQGIPFAGGERPAAADGDHDWWVLSGGRGTFLHALVIPEEWRSWGIKRGIVFRDQADGDATSGAGYRLLRMTNLRRPGAYELGSAFVVMTRPYQPGDEAEALAGVAAQPD